MVEFAELYEAFFDKIENDKDFFNYNNVPIEEAMNIAKMRSERYLYEALSTMSLKCTPDKCGKNFIDFDNDGKVLNYDLTYTELDIIASLMYEKYLFREFSKLKAQANRFVTKDFNVFSPANERNSFIAMYERITKANEGLIDSYNSINHSTGNMLTLDYSTIDED
jgi:hypothetical protein